MWGGLLRSGVFFSRYPTEVGSFVCLVVDVKGVLRGVDTHLEMQCVGQALASGCPLPPARSLHLTCAPMKPQFMEGRQGGYLCCLGVLGLSGGAGLNLSWWLVRGHDRDG